MKQAMISCYEYLQTIEEESYRPYIALQVHDELLFAFPSEDRERNLIHVKSLAWLMESSGRQHGVCCPIEASLIESGKSWADGVKVNLESNE
jgi:DNA polymerase I-like protein with 3'-5' exonuclease and polymerase domains